MCIYKHVRREGVGANLPDIVTFFFCVQMLTVGVEIGGGGGGI